MATTLNWSKCSLIIEYVPAGDTELTQNTKAVRKEHAGKAVVSGEQRNLICFFMKESTVCPFQNSSCARLTTYWSAW